MKVLLAFDSFKGSLSSKEAGEAAAEAIREAVPDASCEVLLMADGGEGTVEALVDAAGGDVEYVTVTGPLGERTLSRAGLIREPDGEWTAVLEAAAICGLTMVPEGRLDPLAAASTGVGEAIAAFMDRGVRRFAVGLGGSAVNDGGMGMLAALGADFRDAGGNRLTGSGRDLLRLSSVSLDRLDERLAECRIDILTDVSNPLCGERGATMVYGRQKGVTKELEGPLDAAMRAYGGMVEAALRRRFPAAGPASSPSAEGVRDSTVGGPGAGASGDKRGLPHNDNRFEAAQPSMQDRPGAGAAGGLGFALMALGGEAVSGAERVIAAARLAERAAEADWVVTGEGRSDRQTLYGKLPLRAAEAVRGSGTGCLLVSGSLGDGMEELAPHFAGCFSIVQEPAELSRCLGQARDWLKLTVRETFRLIDAVHGKRRQT